jgi:hypothetical protein
MELQRSRLVAICRPPEASQHRRPFSLPSLIRSFRHRCHGIAQRRQIPHQISSFVYAGSIEHVEEIGEHSRDNKLQWAPVTRQAVSPGSFPRNLRMWLYAAPFLAESVGILITDSACDFLSTVLVDTRPITRFGRKLHPCNLLHTGVMHCRHRQLTRLSIALTTGIGPLELFDDARPCSRVLGFGGACAREEQAGSAIVAAGRRTAPTQPVTLGILSRGLSVRWRVIYRRGRSAAPRGDWPNNAAEVSGNCAHDG